MSTVKMPSYSQAAHIMNEWADISDAALAGAENVKDGLRTHEQVRDDLLIMKGRVLTLTQEWCKHYEDLKERLK